MTLGGWINLFLSVGFVTGLLGWCLVRMLREQKAAGELARVEPVEKDETPGR